MRGVQDLSCYNTFDREALKEAVDRRGMKMKFVCEQCGITPAAFYRKINTSRFSLADINKISQVIDLSDNEIKQIFFKKGA